MRLGFVPLLEQCFIFILPGDVDLDYKLNITDSSNPEKSLVYLENELIDQDIFLASLSNDVTIEVTGKVIHPKYYKHLKKAAKHSHLGRIACISSKNMRFETKVKLNLFNLECIFIPKTWKVKEITHDLTFYCTCSQLCVPEYKVNV